ncbi:MAG: hypothetical protein WAU91_22475 [Desulfatitalea sp.]
MATLFSEIGQFKTGCLGRQGRLLLCMLDKQLLASRTEHSILYLWDNGQLKDPVTLNWTVAALCYPDWPETEFVAIGKTGRLLDIRRNGATRELDPNTQQGLIIRAVLRNCRVIGGYVYAVGAGHQMIRIASDFSVHDFSVPSEQRASIGETVGFEAVDGFTPEEIYAVGWEGEIWKYNGRYWNIIDSPTNLIHTGIKCAPDGTVYIVGQQGGLLHGRGESWQPVESGTRDDLWDVCWFKDRPYVCSITHLFAMQNGTLAKVPLPPHNPTSFFRLDAIEKALLSVGADDICLLVPDRVLKVL